MLLPKPETVLRAQLFSHVQLFATPWTVALQAPLSMGFPRQKYRSGLMFSSPGDLTLPNPEINPTSSALAGRFFSNCTTWEAPISKYHQPGAQGLNIWTLGGHRYSVHNTYLMRTCKNDDRIAYYLWGMTDLKLSLLSYPSLVRRHFCCCCCWFLSVRCPLDTDVPLLPSFM